MRNFKKNYIVFLIIATCFVGLIGFYSFSKFEESNLKGARTASSHQTLKDVFKLRTSVFEELNDYNTYRLTGRDEDLNDYNFGKKQSMQLITELIVRTNNNSHQNKQVKEIQRQYINLTDAIQAQKPKKITNNQDILNLRNGLIGTVDNFIRQEDGVFGARLESLIALNRNFYIAVVVVSFAALALLMYMNYYLLLAQHRGAFFQKQVEKLKERQSQSFQATRDGLFEWSFQDQGMYWSPRLKEMIGYEDYELQPSAETLEQLMHPDDRDVFWQHLHQHLRGEAPEYSTFFRWQHKDGNWIWINARGRAVFNEFSDPVKLIGVHTDVTKLKEYELQLAKSKDDAEKANSAKSDFLAHMSHEIRTPLTAITGVAEILNMQKEKFDEKTQKLMGALNASAIGLRDLISDILDFSKIENGKIILEQKEIEIQEFFENLISIFALRASEKNLEFNCNYNAIEGLKINGDKTRLRQILINLVGNAIKFTAKGSVKVNAVSIVSDEQELLKIEVIDTGIGIAADQLPYIFDSFRQADASVSRKYGGTGLGLPIARRLAQMMGGNIYVSSEPNVGSIFTLYIPLILSHKEDNLPLKVEHPKSLNLKPEDKILIVEDYEGNIAFITHLMEEMNLKYDLGRTGLEGLKLWTDHKYKMVLMDIQMPEMDGISAVKHIRNIEKEKGVKPVPIIAMTAHAFSEDREKCLKAGFDDYLAKPLSKENLFETMSGLLKKIA